MYLFLQQIEIKNFKGIYVFFKYLLRWYLVRYFTVIVFYYVVFKSLFYFLRYYIFKIEEIIKNYIMCLLVLNIRYIRMRYV